MSQREQVFLSTIISAFLLPCPSAKAKNNDEAEMRILLPQHQGTRMCGQLENHQSTSMLQQPQQEQQMLSPAPKVDCRLRKPKQSF